MLKSPHSTTRRAININKKKKEKTGTGSGSGTGDGEAESKNETEVLHRLSATREADGALNRIVDRINDGFNGGRVSRMQALSWLLIRQAGNLSDALIQEIREEFFDEVAMLEVLLRQAKASGKLPQELRGILQKQVGLGEDVNKKKAKKHLTQSYSLSTIDKDAA